MQNGYDIDILWFYLGEAAYGGGFKDAAVIYYRVALADFVDRNGNRRCGSFIGAMCAGFVFPYQIQQRLSMLASEGYN